MNDNVCMHKILIVRGWYRLAIPVTGCCTHTDQPNMGSKSSGIEQMPNQHPVQNGYNLWPTSTGRGADIDLIGHHSGLGRVIHQELFTDRENLSTTVYILISWHLRGTTRAIMLFVIVMSTRLA